MKGGNEGRRERVAMEGEGRRGREEGGEGGREEGGGRRRRVEGGEGGRKSEYLYFSLKFDYIMCK